MSDLIERQAATTIQVMPKEHRHYQTYNLDDAYEQGWYDLQECIENLPVVQPQQTCEYWDNESEFCALCRPSAQPEKRTEERTKTHACDCVSRQAAIDALMKRDKELRNINWYDKPFAEGECRGIDYALEIVNALPSVQPERLKGRWTKAYDGNDDHVKCTGCFKTYDWISQAQYYNYCPNCGSYNGGDKDDQR